MIDTEILQDYSSEARELLDEMDNSLMRMEKEGGAPELLNNVFRAVHCIKGSAEYIGLERSSTLTHGIETLLDRLREGLISLDSGIVDFLFRAKDLISTLIDEVSRLHKEKSEISGTMAELDQILRQGAGQAKEESEGEPSATPAEEVADLTEGAPEVFEESGAYETMADEEFPPETYTAEPEVEEYEQGEDIIPEFPPEIFTEGFGPESLGEVPEGLITQVEAEPAALEPPPCASLEETVPFVLNLSLYLDDLQDGVTPSDVRSSVLDTLLTLKRTLKVTGPADALSLLDVFENRLISMDPDAETISSQDIGYLRSLLSDLRLYYPEGLFPSEAVTTGPVKAPEAATPAWEEEAPPSPFVRELQLVPGIGSSTISAILGAGYSSMGQLAETDAQTLADIPGIGASMARAIHQCAGAVPSAQERPPIVTKAADRSLLADVDDELLREFEGIFGPEAMGGAEPVPESAHPDATGTEEELLEDVGSIVEEADREIIDIFLSYAWEILEKLNPIVTRISSGKTSRDDFQECADLIKSIRASSTYMDYQTLASFLDDWYEKTVWISDYVHALGAEDMAFMATNFHRFEEFLGRLEAALHPEAPAAVPLPARVGARSSAPATPPLEVGMPERATGPVGAQPGTAAPPPARGPAGPPLTVTDVPVAAQPTSPPYHELAVSNTEPSPVRGPAVTGPPTSEPTTAPAAAARQSVGPPPVESPQEVPTRDLGAATHSATTAERPEGGVQVDLSPETALVKTMRVDSVKVDVLLNQVGELVVNRSYVEQLSLELKNFQRALIAAPVITKKEIQTIKTLTLKVGEASIALGRVANDIQEGVMKLRMLPVGQLFNRMPRLIRDLSRRVGKLVGLQVYGGDTEVDKRVIEQIYNPLVHLIRNAVDHGIEDQEARRMLGKNEEGSIILRAYSQGNQVVVDVEDDGAGINRAAVLEKAVESGLIESPDARALSSQDIFDFLFVPGFSTSKTVTRTSGRGVGMDVVKKDVEKINGHVEIESWESQGTRISIRIPLTLAIIQTLLIRFGRHCFAIPLNAVREIIQISPAEIMTIEGFEVIKFREETIPVLRINETFKLKEYEETRQPGFLVLAMAGNKTVGLLVEELIGEQDVVIKPLAEHVCQIRGLAGSTILGDGTIALVLDVTEMIDDVMARQRQLAGTGLRYAQNGGKSPRLDHSLEM